MDLRSGPVLTVAAALAVGALVTAVAGPRPPELGPERTGDADLAARAVAALDGETSFRGLAVAWVEDGRVTTAGLGTTGGPDDAAVTDATAFEIGSVTKGLTGMLLADAVERGEVALGEPVADLAAGTALQDAGGATLAELATHRSGLPRLDPATTVRGAVSGLTGGDPYRGGPQEVLDAAGAAGAPGGSEEEYSNLGYAALGSALAARTGTPYPELLAERVYAPLGMTGSVAATTAAQVPAGAARGSTASGAEPDPWLAQGWMPAGIGTWSDAADLGRLAAALLDGTAPGVAALEPVADDGDGRRTGLAWVVDDAVPQAGVPAVTWHNGGTAGFRSFVGLDREAGRAVVLLGSGTGEALDAAGVRMLADAAAPGAGQR